MTFLWIGLFAMFGGLARFGLSSLIPMTTTGFPLATLCINLLGAFLLPLWTQWLGNRLNLPEKFILAGGTGFCGAFTTFSSFSVEALHLFTDGQLLWALTYVGISSVGGLALSLISVTIAQYLGRQKQVEELKNEGFK